MLQDTDQQECSPARLLPTEQALLCQVILLSVIDYRLCLHTGDTFEPRCIR